jgi:AraC family L-rhamnose operon transcriptional activator RhaR/AraC family L-rhamnose operon regulatory protein RhaS
MTKKLLKQDYFEDPTLPLQVHVRDPQPEFPSHIHGFDELVIILRGTAVHIVDGQPFPVKSGDVFVVSGRHEHQYQNLHGLALANILFDSRSLQMSQWDVRALSGFHALFALEPVLRAQQKFNNRLHLSEKQLRQVNEMIQTLQCETGARNPGYRIMAEGIFMQLTVFLSRCYSDKPSSESHDLLRLGDAIACIETRFAEKITLDDLAKKAQFSKRHFLRIFQECMGRSPIDHLLHVRIQKATELLAGSDRTITDIAFDCGFTDSNYFTRQFRKTTGHSPSEYRKTRM